MFNMAKSGCNSLKNKLILEFMDSVDSMENVDKTPNILRVYTGYPAGICGV